MMQERCELYRRLAIANMLCGQILRGLLLVPLEILIDPVHIWKRIISLFVGFPKRYLHQQYSLVRRY